MDKDEYRERVLKALEEIRINTDMTDFFVIVSIVSDVLLVIIMFIALFK